MKPSPRFLAGLLILGLLAALLAAMRLWTGVSWPGWLWQGTALLFIVIAAFDAVTVRRQAPITVQRQLPATLALDEAQSITLVLSNPLARAVTADVADLPPPQCRHSGLPARVTIAAGQTVQLCYTVHPMQRGEGLFSATELFLLSPLQLWQYRQRSDNAQTVRIFPNFLAVGRLEGMRFEQQLRHIGIHLAQLRGEGTEFHQLRSYQRGDALRQIDWKATARRRKPISRQYQLEHDHQLIFLLDCGRRMRARNGALAFFDHCLNAVLIAALIAERQGDAVGLLTFAGEPLWFAPQRGPATVKQLINYVYALTTSQHTTDYRQAAEQLLQRHRKRSLVFMLSHLQAEDNEDLLAAHRLLKPHHHLLGIHLQQPLVQQLIDTPVMTGEQALQLFAAHNHHQREQRMIRDLRGLGLPLVSTRPDTLHRELVRQYLLLKRAGSI